ncbi:MAG: hypothetical protein HS109_10820 [Burkholderiales bacterium]|nr:hypothetical protein [Burkholderiales bacterium]
MPNIPAAKPWTVSCRRGKLVRRRLSAEQARLMRQALANYRKVKKLLRAWESETERLIEAEAPRDH